MKVYFEYTDRFRSDLAGLQGEDVLTLRVALSALEEACAAYNPPAAPNAPPAVNPPWPQLLAVEEIKGAVGGLYALTWKFRSNERATFQWSINDGTVLLIRFRRIGIIDSDG
jgi:hypothetical protein